jgi:hypothetical protein
MKVPPGMDGDLTPQARAVLRAFTDAQSRARGFLLSSGVFPDVSESGSEKLHSLIRDLAARHLDQKKADRALRSALTRGCRALESRDPIESALNSLLASETTAAYVFGLAAGLSLASAGEWLKPSARRGQT